MAPRLIHGTPPSQTSLLRQVSLYVEAAGGAWEEAAYRIAEAKKVSAARVVLRTTLGDTITLDDGNEYPLARVEISSASHPFFTGTMKIVDTAGRVERFERRYGKRRQD